MKYNTQVSFKYSTAMNKGCSNHVTWLFGRCSCGARPSSADRSAAGCKGTKQVTTDYQIKDVFLLDWLADGAVPPDPAVSTGAAPTCRDTKQVTKDYQMRDAPLFGCLLDAVVAPDPAVPPAPPQAAEAQNRLPQTTK